MVEKSNNELAKLCLIISILAIVISGISFWRSSMLESRISYSYAEVLEAKYTRIDYKIQEQYLRITGMIELKNEGNHETEIQDIYWKPFLGKDSGVEFRAPTSNKEPFLFLSDNHEIEITLDRNFPLVDKIIPITDIKSYTISPNAVKVIYFLLIAPRSNRGAIIEPSTENYLFIDIFFTLNNGQQIITRPWYRLDTNLLNEGGVP